MEIVTTTKITLSKEEKEALQTLENAFETCVYNDCFDCDECPLHLDNLQCLGELCARVRERSEK